jgi:hypothetical protein
MKTLYKFFKTTEVSQERAGEHETKVEKYNLVKVKPHLKASTTLNHPHIFLEFIKNFLEIKNPKSCYTNFTSKKNT